MTAQVEFSCVLESAFLHDTSGGRIVDEEVRPQSEEPLDIETVIDHCPECFSGDSAVPVWFRYPVADFGIILPYRDIALSVNEVPHTTYCLPGLAQSDSPGAVIGEDVPDHSPALFNVLVRRPSRSGPHVRIGSVSEKHLRIGVHPRT